MPPCDHLRPGSSLPSIVHARGGGFHVALVPAVLNDEQIEAALNELGVEAAAVLELGDWRTSFDSVAVAFVPPLDAN